LSGFPGAGLRDWLDRRFRIGGACCWRLTCGVSANTPFPISSGARYGGNAIRLVAVGAAILASFVYVVAQIYGVGVITSRFVSLQFEIGVFVGLAGILVCSFLGGMRAVTWTQVAQYVILIVAYVTPVAILSLER
jgi:Na+(H+)/acetate symporter ActP